MRPTSSEPAGIHALRGLLAALAVVVTALWAAPPAAAQQALDAYRAAGVIAERYDGYVEVRAGDAPADARALVDSVNAQRRAIYAKRAQETNVPIEEVGKLYATKITETAPPGTYFRQQSGSYVRK
jgi:uncharacterized protein YdbL (DUF1318 family)